MSLVVTDIIIMIYIINNISEFLPGPGDVKVSFEGRLASVETRPAELESALQAVSGRSCQGRQVLSVSEISLVPYLDLTSDWLSSSQCQHPAKTPLW